MTTLKSYQDGSGLSKYAIDHSMIHPAQQELLKETLTRPNCNMLGAPEVLGMLTATALSKNAKKCLDVGTFTGASALAIALGLKSEDGVVITMEISDTHRDLWEKYWTLAGVRDKIQEKVGPAGDTLQALIDNGEAGTFDMAFIDADKTGYDDYYEKCLALLKQGGVIVFDNTLYFGNVLEGSGKNDANTVSIKKLNDKIHKDTDRVFATLLNLADGATIVVKL